MSTQADGLAARGGVLGGEAFPFAGMPARPSGASHAHRRMGVGIQDMRERITQLGGRFEIRFGKKGTTVVASLPVPSVSVQTATQVGS